MKSLIKILVILFPIGILNSCCDDNNKPDPTPTWEKVIFQNPEPDYSLTDVEFYNNDFGIISGSSGYLLKTENGGEYWQTINVGENGVLMCVNILNENEFYTARFCLYKTSNGGGSFTILGNAICYESTVFAIHFFNSNTGIISKGDWVYKTTNGGQDWAQIYEKGFSDKMQFISDSIGYLYGGATWDDISYGELHKTDNWGNNWTNLGATSEVYDSEILAMYFINKDTGYIANHNREICVTYDGGMTWIKRCNDIPTYINDIIFLSENEGYAVGYSGILKTLDGGVSWSWDYKNDSMILRSITKTPDNKRIVAVGSGGIILLRK